MAPPPHCYEGFVEVRGLRDQSCRRRWAGLRGATLCFYGAPREQQPLELLDLDELVGVQKEGGALVLQLRDQKVTLKADSVQAQEMWRGFILTMAKMELPTDLELLPGHLFQLSEALRQERENRRRARSVGTTAVPPLPSCFFDVSRAEAERLLERNAGGGSVVLRPGGHGQGFSISTRQVLSGAALLKHYRVLSVGDGFLVDVDTPHHCSSLDEVVQYFVKQSKGGLQPLQREYSMRLEFVEADAKSSEVTRRPCKPPPCPPRPPAHPHGAAPPAQAPPPLLPKPKATPQHAVREGAGSPPSSAPHPTPRRVPLLPHGHSAADITEELAQKLMVRRALNED
ncbi:LOW QUALITY PROTEIN: signal-transducing adaptor protein 2 [Tympanuchus pallidicinctus]|uniref:LOW QUALITY PROTEIN: signal-transducing adaptor protein 2 n=1 Tax=Tympanuchus pallidicinctus TaxID=109042 RepID=UPI0022871E73|nr:LOW QUALITY PROTEIN: signal-transducing adaptor protein 2 [Tympanuchus pallidicinctus]